jgi:hypothetical protein
MSQAPGRARQAPGGARQAPARRGRPGSPHSKKQTPFRREAQTLLSCTFAPGTVRRTDLEHPALPCLLLTHFSPWGTLVDRSIDSFPNLFRLGIFHSITTMSSAPSGAMLMSPALQSPGALARWGRSAGNAPKIPPESRRDGAADPSPAATEYWLLATGFCLQAPGSRLPAFFVKRYASERK